MFVVDKLKMFFSSLLFRDRVARSPSLKSVFFLLLFAGVVSIELSGGQAWAATLNVPSEYSTIQAAIDAAVAGDTVLVAAGTYLETINFNGKDITLQSLSGPEETILQKPGAENTIGDPIVSMGPLGSLIGFTITGGHNLQTAAGTYARGGGSLIQNNIYTGNEGNVVLYVYDSVIDTVIDKNIFKQNGYVTLSGSYLHISNNLFISNYGKTIGTSTTSSNPGIEIINNTFFNNESAIGGSDVSARNNIIVNNEIGAALDNNGNTIWENNLVFGNKYDYFPADTTLPDQTGLNGNISENPLFVDLANHDYRLNPGSPAIDAGSAVGAPTDDFAGATRPVDGDENGAVAVDMGAYEFIPNTGEFVFSQGTFSVAENQSEISITVRRVAGSTGVASVSFSASGETAVAGVDFTEVSGNLAFADGEEEKTFNIQIIDNKAINENKKVKLTLSTPTDGAILGALSSSILVIKDDESNAMIAAGRDYAMAINAQGDLWAWGNNLNGELGDGTENTVVTKPETIGSLGEWASIAPGNSTLAVKTDKSLWAWGSNFPEVFGKPTTANTLTPIPIGTDKDWLAVDNLLFYAVGLKTDHTLWAWSDVPPSLVNYDTDWVAVSVGSSHYLALKANGSLWAVGDNSFGCLGIPEQSSSTYIYENPVQVAPGTTWIAMAAAWYHSIALKSDGTLWAWGEFGPPEGAILFEPVQVGLDTDWASVTGGRGTSLAIKTDGSLWQIKDSATAPERIETGNDWIAVSAKDQAPWLALKADGSVWEASNGASSSFKSIEGLYLFNGFYFSSAAYNDYANKNSVAITVSRTASPEAASVNFATSDGTAKAGEDYVGVDGTLTFTPLETSKTFEITILDEANFPDAKSINLSLSSPSQGYILSKPNQASLTIMPVPPSVFSFSADNYIVNESGTTATITVIREDPGIGEYSVDYAATEGSATAGTDYVATAGTVTFADGETEKTFEIPIFLDADYNEGDETVNLALSNPTGGASLGSINSAVLTIVPAGQSSISFTLDSFTVNEYENTALITLIRADNDLIEVSVDYATSDGTATAGTDYVATSGTVIFSPGETEAVFEIPIILDAVYDEVAETINLTLSNPSGGAILGTTASAVLTIVPIPASVIQFSDSTYYGYVGNGSATITLVRTGSIDAEVTVDIFTDEEQGGTATPNVDYKNIDKLAPITVTFKEGENTATAEITLLPDQELEQDETVYLAISTPSAGAVLGEITSAVLSIIGQKESTLQFSASTYSVWEHNEKAVITVTRTGGTNSELGIVTVDYATSNGTAEGGFDYEATSGTLILKNGEIEGTIIIPIINDSDTEDPIENFTIKLDNPTNFASLGERSEATIEINDQESGVFSFERASYEPGEGDGFLALKVVRTASTRGDVTVKVFSTGISAKTTQDFSPLAKTLIFLDGETEKTVNLTIIDDDAAEFSETLELSLAFETQNPNFPTQVAMLGLRSSAVVTILDNEAPAFQFEADEFSTSEERGKARIKIERLGSLAGSASVVFSAKEGTAIACTNVVDQECADTDISADYIPVSQTIEFAGGETKKTVDIIILKDTLAEGDETIALKLYDVSTQVQTDSAVLTIGAEDQAGPGILSFESIQILAVEKDKTVTVTLVREYGSDGEVSVKIQTVDNEDFPGYTGDPDSGDFNQDYVPYSEIVTFPDGKLEAEIEITLVDDSISEDDNIFSLLLSDPAGGAVLGNATANIVIVGHSEPGILNFERKTYRAKEAVKQVSVPITRVGTDGNVEADVTLTASEFSEKMELPNYIGGEFTPTAFHITKIPFSQGTCEAVLSFSSLGASIEYKAMNTEGECSETVIEGGMPIFSVDGFFSNSSLDFEYSGIEIDAGNINIFPQNNEDPDEDFIVTVTIDAVYHATTVHADDLPSIDHERSSTEILVEDPEDNKPSGKSYIYKLRSNGNCFIKSLF